MFIRQLEKTQFEALRAALAATGTGPLEASYAVAMTIDGTEYALKPQPARSHRIAVLQAIRTRWDAPMPSRELVTKGNILAALLEILIYQRVGQK